MPHNIVGLDHTLIGVSNLEDARETYQRLGFTVSPRGSHIGWGTANYCIMFPDDYIELLGIVNADLDSNGLDRLLEERGEGLLGLALATDNAEATHQSLTQEGLAPAPVADLKRQLELESGAVTPEFKLVRLRTEGMPQHSLFFCHHLTPDLIRQADWMVHDNGADHIASLVVLVDNPTELREYYTRLCGVINVTQTDSTLTVQIGRLKLIFVNDKDLDLLYPGLTIDEDWPEFPYLLAMTVAVKDLEETGAYLEKAGVQAQKIANGSLRIHPKDACGVLLEFSRA
ncbi:VOC family protein [Sneathiella chinensis]|uniref:Dioxygenase n=1 Tax=Sneathiella chinensis TaxID=349750 RepID=A0ABQ5U4U2_9PROT|nr:VOC family protein [Sneathiella chinensis]GLQ06220.1 dioxygenase [Sneathiella chinensis]